MKNLRCLEKADTKNVEEDQQRTRRIVTAQVAFLRLLARVIADRGQNEKGHGKMEERSGRP